MRRYFECLAFVFVITAASVANAQDELKLPKPEKEHQWLKQFVGQWQTESEAKMGPDDPLMKSTGTMSVRSLGGFWVISEYVAEMPGMTMKGVQTIGYAPEKKKYVGTWVDSVTSHLWTYEGVVDDTGKTLTLEAKGPNFMADGKMATFRDIYTFKSEDLIVVRSSMQSDDGSWIEFMKGQFRRKR